MDSDEVKTQRFKPEVPCSESPALVEEDEGGDSTTKPVAKAESMASNSMRTRKQKSDRIARLTFQELQPFFTMPLYEAAAKLKVCGTVLKRISRRCGIPTWPFRQVSVASAGTGHWARLIACLLLVAVCANVIHPDRSAT